MDCILKIQVYSAYCRDNNIWENYSGLKPPAWSWKCFLTHTTTNPVMGLEKAIFECRKRTQECQGVEFGRMIGFNYKTCSASCLQHYLLNHKHSEMDVLTQRYFYWEDTFKLLRNVKAGQERKMLHLSGKCWQNLKCIVMGAEQVIAVLSLGGLDREEKGGENRDWNLNSSVKLSSF